MEERPVFFPQGTRPLAAVPGAASPFATMDFLLQTKRSARGSDRPNEASAAKPDILRGPDLTGFKNWWMANRNSRLTDTLSEMRMSSLCL